jgi:hypothetical protein
MTDLNLDALERLSHDLVVSMSAEDKALVNAAVAELRAARKVVGAARAYVDAGCPDREPPAYLTTEEWVAATALFRTTRTALQDELADWNEL